MIERNDIRVWTHDMCGSIIPIVKDESIHFYSCSFGFFFITHFSRSEDCWSKLWWRYVRSRGQHPSTTSTAF